MCIEQYISHIADVYNSHGNIHDANELQCWEIRHF